MQAPQLRIKANRDMAKLEKQFSILVNPRPTLSEYQQGFFYIPAQAQRFTQSFPQLGSTPTLAYS